MSCCKPAYWCTETGISTGTYDEETGVRYPPVEYFAGPFASEQEAWDVCSPPFPCEACEPEDDSVPRQIYAHFVNKTGAAVSLPDVVRMGFATEPNYPSYDLTPPPYPLVTCGGSPSHGLDMLANFGYSTLAPKFGVIRLGEMTAGASVAWGGPSMDSNQWWCRVCFNTGWMFTVSGLTVCPWNDYSAYQFGVPPFPGGLYPGWNFPGEQGAIYSKVVPCGLCVEDVVFEGLQTWSFMTGDPPNGTYDLVLSRNP